MNFESDVITDEWLEVTSRACFDSAVRQMARELLARRRADKARAAVPMPLSRERMLFLAERKHPDAPVPLSADGMKILPTTKEVAHLARFALAHMDINQLLLGNEAPNETEPTQEQAQVVRARVSQPPTDVADECSTAEERRLFSGLLAIVKEGPNGPHKTAALILLGVEPR